MNVKNTSGVAVRRFHNKLFANYFILTEMGKPNV